MRCPACGSRKWHGNNKGCWKCGRCGNEWKDPSLYKTISPNVPRIGDDNPQNNTSNRREFLKDKSQLLSMDFHDNMYIFNIIQDNPTVSIGTKSNMTNWTQEVLTRGNVKFKRTTKSIIISVKRRFIEDLYNTNDFAQRDDKIKEFFVNQAKSFQKEFNIILDIDNPVLLMREIKSIDGFKSPILFQSDKFKCVYPENMSLEAIKKEASESWKNFIDNMAVETKADSILESMRNLDQKLAPSIDKLATQINLHLAVQNETRYVLENLNETIVKMPEAVAQSVSKSLLEAKKPSLWSRIKKLFR